MEETRNPHFLVGFDPSSSSQKMSIPLKFINHLEGRVPGTAVLAGPSRKKWYADLIEVDGGLFFSDGWGTFVGDHILEQGDSLVFRYDGDLHFTVQVFDDTMCEKATAFSAESNSQDLIRFNGCGAKKRDRDVLDCIVKGFPKKMRSVLVDCGKITHQSSSSEVESMPVPQDGIAGNSVMVAKPLRAVPYEIPDPCGRDITTKEDILLSPLEAERIAKSFSSSFPSFFKVMKRFNISGSYTLNVPYQFAVENLPGSKLKIVLQNLKGESWTVNSIPTTIKVQTAHTFCGGWLGFVRDNGISIGDICIFELVCNFELRVRILRVRQETIDDHDGELIKKRRNVSSESSKFKPMRGTESDIRILESEICKSLGSNEKHGSHIKSCMSMKSSPEEKIAAQYFASSFPHFVRIMKNFNVSCSYTLKIPYQFSMENLRDSKTEIVLRTRNGKSWTVNSIPCTRVKILHTFCGGWMAFGKDNDIKLGDICIFELVGKCQFCVHICGIGKKRVDLPEYFMKPSAFSILNSSLIKPMCPRFFYS